MDELGGILLCLPAALPLRTSNNQQDTQLFHWAVLAISLPWRVRRPAIESFPISPLPRFVHLASTRYVLSGVWGACHRPEHRAAL